MPFDPDAYLKTKSDQRKGFDPDAYIEMRKKQPSQTEAAMRGAAQGATFGFADEISAAMGALADVGQAALGQRGDISLKDAYQTRRDAIRARDLEAQELHPKTFGAGQIGGAVSTAFVPGLGALNVGKGAKIGEVLGKNFAAGAAQGLGASQADILEGEVFQAGAESLAGGAISAGLGGIGAAAGKAIKADKLKEIAAKKFFKGAVGRQAGFDKKLTDEVRVKLGNYLRKEAGVKGGFSPANILKKLDAQKEKLSEGFDDVAAKFGNKKFVDGETIAENMRKYADEIETPATEGVAKYVRDQADKWAEAGWLSMPKATKWRNGYKFEFGQEQSMKVGKKAINDMWRIARNEMDNAVEAAEKMGDLPENIFNQYKDLKRQWHLNDLIYDPTKELAERFGRNRTLSLTDYLTGLTGFSAGDPTFGVGPAVANRMLRERGNTALGASLENLAIALGKTPEEIAKYYQAATRAATETAVRDFGIPKDNFQKPRQGFSIPE